MESPLVREARTVHRSGRSTRLGAFADTGQERQLGFRIDPLEVRLITGPHELYTWIYLPEMEHLFQKLLSKHTMGACLELYAGVGKTFEAIRTGAHSATGAADCLTESTSALQARSSSWSRSICCYSKTIFTLSRRVNVGKHR
jgi:hypothetical protein